MDERILKNTANKIKMAWDAENPEQAIIDALMDSGENAMAEIWHEIVENEIMIVGVNEHIKIMQERKRRMEDRIDSLRAAMLFFLQRTNQQNFKHALFTASLKETPGALVVEDESLLPPSVFKRQEPVLDKKELRACLEAGEIIEGAYIEDKKLTLQIRSK